MIAILANGPLGRRAGRNRECRERSPIGSGNPYIRPIRVKNWYLLPPGSGGFPSNAHNSELAALANVARQIVRGTLGGFTDQSRVWAKGCGRIPIRK
jgi:hypothetical protein